MIQNTNDRLIRIDEVLKELGIKRTNFYETIKELKNKFEIEENENKKQEIFAIYILIKPKKFGRTSVWSYNQIQQFINLIRIGEIEKILSYVKSKNVA